MSPAEAPRTGKRLVPSDFVRAFKRFSADQMTDRAAALTYYSLLSLFPALLFSVANRSLGDVLTSESVAIEIARSAVGGVALALSVPLTTAIAAVLATPAVNS